MPATDISPDRTAAEAARRGGPQLLAQCLRASRQDTLSTFAALEAVLPELQVPLHPELNPPLWELGHIGWFQQHWISRNPQRHRGWDADPGAAQADADDRLYDSSAVPHDSRWQLKLPDADTLRTQLAGQLEQTLACLQALDDSDPRALYFYRLALQHEDMHHEAALYMAQQLGLPLENARWQAPVLPTPGPALEIPAGTLLLGAGMEDGFRFDNELGHAVQQMEPFQIDAQVLRWAEYLRFVETGAGPMPRYLRCEGRQWEQWRHGRWQALDLHQPACHLSWHEAQSWCRWAGRRLPTEAEWVWALRSSPERLRWGDVWEWTASAFAPWPGFQPHPYRDYSQPWFDGRPVLRGASFMTQPRVRHPDYRNFFPATRNDIAAGFRSCAP
ncbi:hypothetical protein C6P61_03965 [Malikia spinosa]|uniref:Ergothioneine biosynthesis protein EgtB n=1 Tax=Malikia spinosa TaxID=86180 RepID=A0A2S9KH85_9BURK|nr:selenoneine synthase SenA [Malikia spinosa]PRD69802.1 hypothetical protein C6P61_03965 [Malikia spinosa]